MEIHKTAAFLIIKEGKVLLIRRLNPPDADMWAVPGGHIEDGESPFQAAKREASEEVPGTVVDDDNVLVFNYTVHGGDKYVKETHMHRCYVFTASPSPEIRTGSDAGEYVWVDPEEVIKPGFLMSRPSRYMLKRLVETRDRKLLGNP